MGQRGPKPGQYTMRMMPAGSPASPRGPRFKPGAATCPAWLGAAAKKVFKRVVREMGEAGTAATVDGDLIASYATAAADLAAVTQAIDKAGIVVAVPTVDRNGNLTGQTIDKPNPLLRTKDALLGRVKQLADALGIGPAARSRAGASAELPTAASGNKVLDIRDRIQAARNRGGD